MLQIEEKWIIIALIVIIIYLYWTGRLALKQGFDYIKRRFSGYWKDAAAQQALMRTRSPIMVSYL